MSYRGLTDEEYVDMAINVLPSSDESKWLSAYTAEFDKLRRGRDEILLPKSHAGFLREMSHKGGRKLNSVVQDARNWAVLRDIWVRVTPQDSSDESAQAAGRMRQFFELAMEDMRYHGSHDTLAEVIDDMLTSGIGIRRMNPRAEYFRDWRKITEAEDLSDQQKRDAFDALPNTELANVIVNDRVPPGSFQFIQDADGEIGAAQERGTRPLGPMAKRFGLERAEEMFGQLDFGPSTSVRVGQTMQTASILTAELWVEDEGVLIWLDGMGIGRPGMGPQPIAGRKLKGTIGAADRILDRWPNQWGKPPYYLRPVSPFPWESPLDSMMHMVNEFNYWDTLRQVQLHAGVLRTFTLVRKLESGGVGAPVIDTDDSPKTITLKQGQPLPYMGPGFEWILSPFDEIDVETGYQNASKEIEAAGDLVKALSGSSINQNTAVGTASMMFNSAQRGLSPMIRAEAKAVSEELIDFAVWVRDTFKEPITVHGMRMPELGEEGGLQAITQVLEPEDIVTTNIEVVIRPMLPVDQAADLAKAEQTIQGGLKTIDGVVEAGWIPGENDPELLKDKLQLAALEAGMANIDTTVALEAYEQSRRSGTPPGSVSARDLQESGGTGAGLVDQFNNPLSSKNASGGRSASNVRHTGLASGDGNIQRQGSVASP